ncbi:MAG: NAD(P)/FAD-dependent oxidoreductase [Clostridia bacterium]|nr:NAD(P)/FAD-dependent oxidoreductase [Clostridia bacterium]
MTFTPSADMNESKKIAVIGGGAAGMMAAGTALSLGASVTIFEHMSHLGKKLAITGKDRCNVTNTASGEALMENVTRNPRFLYSAFNSFTTEDTQTFFTSLGVKLKVERGGRVFPESDKAKDIVDALRAYCSAAEIIHEHVRSVTKNASGTLTVHTKEGEYTFGAVILATGGKSYPLTGSDGSGYAIARKLGHTVTELIPSLIPLTSPSPLPQMMQGLSLKNVGITVRDESKNELYRDFGEMMFTHFGVTGPVILSASARLRERDISRLTLSIDLKPALDEATLDTRLLSDFKKNINRDFINSLDGLLPQKMILPFIEYCKIDPRAKVNAITKEQRQTILRALKSFDIPLSGLRPIEEAIITSGGISVKEISPKTMESRIAEGVYFAGEVIDVDAYTGGFNLQIAFSTAYLAGKSAAEKLIYE